MLPCTSSSSAVPSTVVMLAGETSAAVAELRRPDRLLLSDILGEDYERRAADSLTSSEVEQLLDVNARLERRVLFFRDREPLRRPRSWQTDHTPQIFFSASGNEEAASKTKFDCCRHCRKTFEDSCNRK
ncbi:hypothetical protein AAVH_17371, partial [Aphelenchoides avenae]